MVKVNLYYVSMEIRVIEELEEVNPTNQLVSKDEEVRQGCRDRKYLTSHFENKNNAKGLNFKWVSSIYNTKSAMDPQALYIKLILDKKYIGKESDVVSKVNERPMVRVRR
ncbi:unnamed protein product [Rhizophagus irregularis]|uniref:Uncharacterized protein n=1 Tax=Rhizophagus irregularis TaxID=588596 RepID=A0A916DXQ3_9GLOM|nr:unnamed protein product [Rhizophagus irregularis]CAB5302430.1 unnamed protein product [Rhizophagus irregularis]